MGAVEVMKKGIKRGEFLGEAAADALLIYLHLFDADRLLLLLLSKVPIYTFV